MTYSITLSARRKIDDGIVMPKALAALRFTGRGGKRSAAARLPVATVSPTTNASRDFGL